MEKLPSRLSFFLLSICMYIREKYTYGAYEVIMVQLSLMQWATIAV